MESYLWISAILVFGLSPGSAVPKSYLYKYGPEIDKSLCKGHETSSPEILLKVPIVFYNETYYSVYVNANGLLSFLTDIPSFLNIQFPLDYPVIAPFYANADTRHTGNVYFRETDDHNLLTRATRSIRDSFLSGQHFSATSLFITTWHNMGHYNLGGDKVNTLQVVIANNGTDSYVEYIYPEGGIQWIEGTTVDTRLPDARAQIGMVAGDGRFYNLHNSGKDQVQHVERLSNVGQQGVWMFRIGQVNRHDNIMLPDLKESVGRMLDETCSTRGVTTCHSRALCLDVNHGFCCQCKEGFYGNGIECFANDMPLRVSGKLSGRVNGVELNELDIQSYVTASDGRTYTAISNVPQSVGYDMQLLYMVGGVTGWLFARPVNNAMNGFGLTGGVFNHTAVLKFSQTGEGITLWQNYQGLDVFNQLYVKIKLQGTLPSISRGMKVEIPQYEDHYVRSAPGTIISRTNHFFKLEGVSGENPTEVEHVIHYEECKSNPPNITNLYTQIKKNLVVYETLEKIARYGMTSTVFLPEDNNPCQEGRYTCIENSICVVDGYDYQCICHPGYQYLITDNSTGSVAACIDFNECTSGIHNCHSLASCVNEEGSYRCICNTGYIGDGRICIAENCIVANNCSPFATCQYDTVINDYICSCIPGYYGDGTSCYETDTLNPHCNNTECWCPYDFQLEGLLCIKTRNVEPTTENNVSGITLPCGNDCHMNAQCIYVIDTDTYGCSCNPGYEGNGLLCENFVNFCDNRRSCGSGEECVYDEAIKRFKCVCDQFHRDNGTHCLHVRSCKNNSEMCSANATCVLNQNGVLMCECNHGFVGNGTTCRLRPQETQDYSVFLTQGMAILRITISDEKIESLPIMMKPFQEAVGVTVDCVQERVYWSDIAHKNIRSSFYNGTDATIFLNSGLGSLEGISIDWISRNIYWTDSDRDTIEVANLDHKGRRILISSGLVNPRGIAVYPEFGIMFWSDWNRRAPKLESASLDGSNRKVFLQGDYVILPNSLAIDWQNNDLCWADAGVNAIVCSAINNPSPKIVVEGISYPFGLAITDTNYFWTDWQTQKIESMRKHNGHRNEAIVSPLKAIGKLYGLTAVPGECRKRINTAVSETGLYETHQQCLPNEPEEHNCDCVLSREEGSGSEIVC